MSISSDGKPADRKPLPDLKLAGLVHDLNNVFQTLVDVADVLSHECSDPQSAKLAAAILRTVDRGKNITLDLQDRNANRPEVASSEGTPLDKIVANAIAFLEDSQIAGRGPKVRFACELEPGLALGSGHVGRWAWERVFINLFVNSVRAMPTGGTVTVAARRGLPGQMEIFVRDQGCGIAPELQDRLFEPHVSGSASTGLGLHIVKTIVESDGGYVRTSNLQGKPGAEFVITVPLRVTNDKPALLATPAHA
jgi:signal transduction histidine kinase